VFIVTATLKSAAFYGQSRNYTMDVPKLEKESSADYEKRTWRNRLHTMPDGKVFIPPTAFKNCLSEAAKYLSIQIPGKGKSTYTKHIEAGVLANPEPIILDINAETVDGMWLFLPASGKRGDGKRVWKCMPYIKEWSADVDFQVYDETVTEDIFRYHLEQAGKFIGIGYFRPRNNGYWGRFSVSKMTWKKV
jgi:hypothetical protein